MIEWCKRLSDRETIEIDRANVVCGTDKKTEKMKQKKSFQESQTILYTRQFQIEGSEYLTKKFSLLSFFLFSFISISAEERIRSRQRNTFPRLYELFNRVGRKFFY